MQMNQKHYLKDRHCQNEFMKTKKKRKTKSMPHSRNTHSTKEQREAEVKR